MRHRLVLLLAGAAAISAFPATAGAGTISITLPGNTWVAEEVPGVVISGTAEPANADGDKTGSVTAVVQHDATCPSEPPTFGQSDPRAADYFGPNGLPAGGPFSFTSAITVVGSGTVCAWLVERQAYTVTAASARLQPRFRVSRREGGFPFLSSYPFATDGGGLTTYFSAGHRLTRFVAQCRDRRSGSRSGPHDRQRFTLRDAVRPDPVTGAFTVSGVAKPDNSRNY